MRLYIYENKNFKKQEIKMRLREKIMIFLVAVLVSFLVFNLIASSSVRMLKVGKEAGYEIISNYLEKEAISSNQSCPI